MLRSLVGSEMCIRDRPNTPETTESVGQSSQHLTTRIKEHSRVSAPVGSHFLQCGVKFSLDDVRKDLSNVTNTKTFKDP